ncbi:MAG TPA: alpha/beta hydrolase [Nevskiaceae bacterium]|nr:alpha/beta hydrolase [Nevskiaceae bacterium]
MSYARMRDGAKLHYLDVGHGPVCVLVHGFAMFGAMWLPFVAPLASRCRFIVPDLRGWGKSHDQRLSRTDAICQHADDLADLISGLGVDHVHLAGLSMGACASLEFLRRYGTRSIDAYLNVDQSPCIPNDSEWRWGLLGTGQSKFFAAWRQLIADFEPWLDRRFDELPPFMRARLFATLGEFIGYAFYRHSLRALRFPAAREALMRLVMPVSNWPIYIATMRSFVEGAHDWRESLTHVDVPVTAMIGAESRLYPAAGQAEIARLAPRGQVVKVAHAGHVVPFDAPQRFTRELARFLAASPARERSRFAPLRAVA